MKESDKRRTPSNNQSKRSGKSERRLKQTTNGIESKSLHAEPDSSSTILVSDSNTGSEPSEVYDNLVIHYVDDVNRSEEPPQDSKADSMVTRGNKGDALDDHSGDLDREAKEGKEDESDSETTQDSVSSHGDSLTADGEKVENVLIVPKTVSNKNLLESGPPRGSRVKSDRNTSIPRSKAVNNTPKKPAKINKGPLKATSKSSFDKNSKDTRVPPTPSLESSEGVDDKPAEDVKDIDEASNGTQSVASDNETVDAEENGEHEAEAELNQKIEDMEMRIGKLEAELREVAALEISLYSVVPEHGSSAHKVHTPARRLSRLYIHACKHWTQVKRATVAKNTVSGLVLISKSCGNDVPRLTFWLSNTIVLREIISQAFGSSRHSSPLARLAESNGGSKKGEGKPTQLKWKGGSGSKQVNGFMQIDDDWQETGTFTAALERVESWIFSRVVESVWWQALTPHMQSPTGDLSSNKTTGRLLGPALGDQQQGSFSINLWKNAFQDALQRLCPVRAGGHECGCLPIIARMVMEQCVARLDVAMFNAILRESAHEIPTDPVSDPILDSKVLPIPAGDLSFGSGAQLKNSVGNWSRWLTDMFGIDADDSLKEDEHGSEDNDKQDSEAKPFLLLNDLSDLLMLPKDMLMDRSIRKEVCPSISLSLIKRILCNFTPDEFCPDAVPGAVLEALNAEGTTVEWRLSRYDARNFPYTAAPVVYTPPSSADVAEKVAEAGTSVSAVEECICCAEERVHQ
uniref:Dilute domain-containing protein n=2 Tax=Salix viminalis TaxID=40686 RepID=A0A6N2N8Y8_SALVM